MGSLSYEPRRNLSVYIGIYYRPITAGNKRILLLREVYSLPAGRLAKMRSPPKPRHRRWRAKEGPFCPVIFGLKIHNSLQYKLIQNVRLSRADIPEKKLLFRVFRCLFGLLFFNTGLYSLFSLQPIIQITAILTSIFNPLLSALFYDFSCIIPEHPDPGQSTAHHSQFRPL